MLRKIDRLAATFAVGIAFSFLSACTSKDAKEHTHPLLEACSKECPYAKSSEAVLECAVSKEKDPEFQKTSCGIAKAEHDKKAGASSSSQPNLEDTLKQQDK